MVVCTLKCCSAQNEGLKGIWKIFFFGFLWGIFSSYISNIRNAMDLQHDQHVFILEARHDLWKTRMGTAEPFYR